MRRSWAAMVALLALGIVLLAPAPVVAAGPIIDPNGGDKARQPRLSRGSLDEPNESGSAATAMAAKLRSLGDWLWSEVMAGRLGSFLGLAGVASKEGSDPDPYGGVEAGGKNSSDYDPFG